VSRAPLPAQGITYYSVTFTDIKISMDGRGRYQDNIFIERLWWTVKYYYLYLHAFASGTELRQRFKDWFLYYNQERSHQSLNDRTPNEIYYQRTNLETA